MKLIGCKAHKKIDARKDKSLHKHRGGRKKEGRSALPEEKSYRGKEWDADCYKNTSRESGTRTNCLCAAVASIVDLSASQSPRAQKAFASARKRFEHGSSTCWEERICRSSAQLLRRA